ncbi:MAG: NAD(P)-dependent dehydrogenase (short-subunit alcohol dehydrogenase family), partial [Phenylobacterium sp.]
LRQQQIQQRILTPVKTLARAANYQQQRFLITGGLSTLGLLLAEHLAQNGADAIILCHNSAANLGQLQRLTALEQLGCQVQIRQLDVCNEQQVKTLFNDTTVRLDGIFHLAGTSATTCADECKLADLQAEKVQSILSPKTTGSWLLHHCSRSQPLRYFVCFSCVSAVFGCAGQSINSAANYAQSWLASHRHAKGLPALTISWSGQSQSAAQTLETMQQMLLLPNANLLVSSTNFQAKCSYLD